MTKRARRGTHRADSNTRAMYCVIVSDRAQVRADVTRVMEGDGYPCLDADGRHGALEHLQHLRAHLSGDENTMPIVLLDCALPEMQDAELLRQIRSSWFDVALIAIADDSAAARVARCLQEGALDYLSYPLQADDVRVRMGIALEKRRLLVENARYRTALEERVTQQAHKYEELFLASLQSLADALEVKDAYTWGHSTRVARYAVAIARELSVPQQLLDQIELGARLHDLGKIGVRESVLNKDGALTAEEYAHVMEHPVIGWRLLAPLMREVPHALSVVRSHHERFDGQGTPDGLSGYAIPIEARIAAVADSFDAMTSGRVYRVGMSVDDAVAELRRCSGTQFDPACVAAFERAISRQGFPRPDWSVQAPTRSLQVVA